MTWKQIKAKALRIVDEVAQRKADLELTEYQNKVCYRSDYPAGMTMRDHNAIVRGAMREDFASWHILCVEARQNHGSRGHNSPRVLAPTISLCKPLRMHGRDKLVGMRTGCSCEALRFEDLGLELVAEGFYKVFFHDLELGEFDMEELRLACPRVAMTVRLRCGLEPRKTVETPSFDLGQFSALAPEVDRESYRHDGKNRTKLIYKPRGSPCVARERREDVLDK
jgi:hypothetical protein